MKRHLLTATRIFLAATCIILLPALGRTQSEQTNPGLPPISQELVREGDFAVKLHPALGLGSVQDEVEAENGLGKAGVMPRNGWIADYPVTPDIIGELQKSVEDAAASGKLGLDKAEALSRLNAVAAESSLGIRPQSSVVSTEELHPEPAAQDYPNPTVINNYYQSEGPPVVTYYSPPPDYYYLYGWIPYPFWWAGFWFPGYFILHDFHRSFHAHNRVSFVSNHFNDSRSHRVHRVDPVARFNGRTFAGIGVSNRRGFISTGVPRSQRSIFNAPHSQAAPGMRPLPGMRSGYRSDGASGRSFAPAGQGRGRAVAAPPRGTGTNRSFSAPARSGGTGRSFSAPSRGGGAAGRTFSAPAGGGGAGRGMGAPAGGGGGAGARGR
jgi:hypothetical protein